MYIYLGTLTYGVEVEYMLCYVMYDAGSARGKERNVTN